MNKIDRIKCVLSGGVPDRIPVMTHNFMMAARELNMSMSEYRSSPKNVCRALATAAEKYDTDGILLDVDTALLAGACGADVVFPNDIPAVVSDEQNYTLEAIIDRIGQCDILANPRVQQYLEAVGMLYEWCNTNGVYLRANADQGVFSLAFLSMGMNEFLVNILDEDMEGDIFKLMDVCYANVVKFHKAVSAAGGHCTSYGNSACGCSMVSPSVYRKYAKPYDTKLAAELKKCAITTIEHICGWVDPILGDLADVGIPAYEFDQKTDIRLAQQAGSGKFALSGNLDPSELMCNSTPEKVYEEAAKLLDLFHAKGGLMLGPGCALPANTPPENIFALVKAAKDRG